MKQMQLLVYTILIVPGYLEGAYTGVERQKIDYQINNLSSVASQFQQKDIKGARDTIARMKSSGNWDDLYLALTKFADRLEALVNSEAQAEAKKTAQIPDWQQQWIAYISTHTVSLLKGDSTKSIRLNIRADQDFDAILAQLAIRDPGSTEGGIVYKGPRPVQSQQINNLQELSDAIMHFKPSFYRTKDAKQIIAAREKLKAGKPSWQQKWIDYIAENSLGNREDSIDIDIDVRGGNKKLKMLARVSSKDDFSTILQQVNNYNEIQKMEVSRYLGIEETREDITTLQQFSNAIMSGQHIFAY